MAMNMVHQTDLASLGKFALVILNNSLPRQVQTLWKKAQLRVCADGGANRLFRETPSPEKYIPDFIIGDMDSLHEDVREFYTSKDTKILAKPDDQDTTDLHKCVAYIKDSFPTPDNLRILVLGGLGGRFDHELGNINVLYSFPTLRICLMNNHNLVFLLPKGFKHELRVTPGAHCGLAPVGCPSLSSTTTGLRWNLNRSKMEFGSLVSTSNIVESEIVTVDSDADLLWTMEM